MPRDIPVVSDDRPDDSDDPIFMVARAVGMFGLGLYRLIKSHESRGIPNSVELLALKGNVSKGKIRATCRKLADGGWIEFDSIAENAVPPIKPDRNREPANVYLVEARGAGGHYKIGVARNLKHRLESLNGSQSPFELALVHSVFVRRPYDLEVSLHERFKHDRVRGEWFELNFVGVQICITTMNEWDGEG